METKLFKNMYKQIVSKSVQNFRCVKCHFKLIKYIQRKKTPNTRSEDALNNYYNNRIIRFFIRSRDRIIRGCILFVYDNGSTLIIRTYAHFSFKTNTACVTVPFCRISRFDAGDHNEIGIALIITIRYILYLTVSALYT